MNIRIIYHSQSGNTEKLALALADELHISAERIGKDEITFTEPVDLLFVGDGIYWAKPHKSTRALFEKIDTSLVKNAAVFATYGNQFKIGDDIKKLLQDKGIHVIGEPFTCKGASVGTKNQGHPDEADLQNVRKFAQDILSNL